MLDIVEMKKLSGSWRSCRCFEEIDEVFTKTLLLNHRHACSRAAFLPWTAVAEAPRNGACAPSMYNHNCVENRKCSRYQDEDSMVDTQTPDFHPTISEQWFVQSEISV